MLEKFHVSQKDIVHVQEERLRSVTKEILLTQEIPEKDASLATDALIKADLRGVDLSGADLSGADLSGADLSGANLTGVNLSGSALFESIFNDTQIEGVNWTNSQYQFCFFMCFQYFYNQDL